MTVPALLVGFPSQSSPDHPAKAALLGRQWDICWTAGNVFFRPISSLGALGYAFTSFSTYHSSTTNTDWRIFAVAAFMHVVIILHSAINMQPLNDKIAALDSDTKGTLNTAGPFGAEALMRRWGKFNLVRVVAPTIAGISAISQLLL